MYKLKPWPAVGCPRYFLLDEQWSAVLLYTVAMTYKPVAVGERIGRAMTCGLKLALVAFEENRATTLSPGHAVAVELRTSHLLASAHSHTIVAL